VTAQRSAKEAQGVNSSTVLPLTVERELGYMSAPWREAFKGRVPAIVHAARAARLVLHQFKYPVAATILDIRGRITGGPFRGLRYPRSGIGNFHDILGTYECWLVPAIEAAIARNPSIIVDVGAAYGYYALGFARRLPGSHVIAYEMDPTRADLIRKYKRINRIDSLEIRGACTQESLGRDLALAPDALVFMDVEGAEDLLLRPDRIAGLRHAEIIVETHETFVPGIVELLRERFASTHDQYAITNTAPQAPAEIDCPGSFFIRAQWRRMAQNLAERMVWLHFVPIAPC
jgi:hypothetical protein